MNTWPANEKACWGVMCHLHATCERYRACEGNTNQKQVYIGTCGADRPLYIPIQPAKKAAA